MWWWWWWHRRGSKSSDNSWKPFKWNRKWTEMMVIHPNAIVNQWSSTTIWNSIDHHSKPNETISMKFRSNSGLMSWVKLIWIGDKNSEISLKRLSRIDKFTSIADQITLPYSNNSTKDRSRMLISTLHIQHTRKSSSLQFILKEDVQMNQKVVQYWWGHLKFSCQAIFSCKH